MPNTSNVLITTELIYDPRATQVTFFSPALGVRRSFFVYVPPTIGSGERVPSVYFLRGHEREWLNRREDSSRTGNVIDVYEQLRAARVVGPLVLVFPGMSSEDNRVPGLLTNMRAPELANHAPGIGSGRFEDYFFEDLIPYVDSHFPTMPNGRRRAITGFSLGGVMATKAALRRPDMFAAAGAYDGSFLYATDRGRRVRVRDRLLNNPMLDPVFGVPRDIPFVAANSPPSMALRADPASLHQVTWVIGYGPEDREPWQSNYYRGAHFVACLESKGLTNAFPGVLAGGDHSWLAADRFVEHTLPIYDTAMRTP